MTEKDQGTIRWYDETRGYGFIDADSGGDVFLHRNAFLDIAPLAGDRVAYVIGPDPKTGRPAAREVELI